MSYIQQHQNNEKKADEPNKMYYFMYNILTNELNEIEIEIEQLKKMMKYLIYNKYVNNKSITDEKFFEQISEICSNIN